MTIKNGLYTFKPANQKSCIHANVDSPVNLVPLNSGNKNQKWRITPVKGSEDVYRITNADGTRQLTYGSGGTHDQYGNGYIKLKAGAEDTEWVIKVSEKGYRISTRVEGKELFIDSDYKQGTVYPWPSEEQSDSQHWKIEPAVQSKTGTFEQNFFKLTVEEAAKCNPGEEYDYIIVGSGIGGGVLCNDLYDTNRKLGDMCQRILLLEKGGLVFHSHCLNTARPSGLANDRGQQNDTFFHKFKEDFTFDPPVTEKEWKGGAMYNLGGRSAAWGLFAPRVHDTVLRSKFSDEVADDLIRDYYRKAERLMLLSTPKTKRAHQYIMDRLNVHGTKADSHSSVQWQWGRIASEFRDEHNFDFAEGAYSTIDKILEIAMSQPEDPREHQDFKTVLNADVRSLTFEDDEEDGKSAVNGVVVRDLNGDCHTIKVKRGGRVILCAGSVESPAILLRSPQVGRQVIRENRGLRLTDHDILFYTRAFRYTDPKLREEYGAMKLQSYAMLPDNAGDNRLVLLNMSIDASSFLPRGASPDDSLSQFIMVFMMQRDLVAGSDINIDQDTGEPKVKMARGKKATPAQEAAMQKLAAASMDALTEAAKIQFDGFENYKEIPPERINLKYLQLGGVAHELGTLPINTSTEAEGGEGCLDKNLQFLPEKYKGLYVCDLSVFPWSPAANPTLTLAALAIRLSRHLLPRSYLVPQPGKICVVNHSSARVKVWLTHRRNKGEKGGETEEERIMEPGGIEYWDRLSDVVQGLFVYKLDLVQQQREKELKDEVADQEADESALASAKGAEKKAIQDRMAKRKERIERATKLQQEGHEFVDTPIIVNVTPGVNAIQHDARDGIRVIHRGSIPENPEEDN